MMELRYAAASIGIATVFSLSACPVFAQAVQDDDSLFAQEEMTITDTVAGKLPAAEGSGDSDFLNELFGEEKVVLPEDLGAAVEALPLEGLPAGDAAQPVTPEVVPESLDAVVEGIAAKPAADIDAFPLEKGFDADAVLGEMLEMGDSTAVAEIATGGDTNTPVPAVDTAAAKGDDLDAMLGEMVAAEPDAVSGDAGAVAEVAPVVAVAEPVVAEVEPVVAVAEPVVAEVEPVVAVAEPVVAEVEPVVAVAEPVVAEVEPVVAVAEPVVAEVEPVVAVAEPVVAEPVAVAATDDLGFLFDAPPALAQPDPVAEAPVVAEVTEEKGAPAADTLDSLFGETPVAVADPAPVAVAEPAVVAVADPAPVAVAEPAVVAGDDLDALISGLAGEAEGVAPVAEVAPETPAVAEVTPETPAVAEVTPEAPAVAEVAPVDDDPMALGDDIFKSLAKVGKKDIRKSPPSVKAPGVAADPFVDALSQPATPVAESVAAPSEIDAPAAEPVAAPAEVDIPVTEPVAVTADVDDLFAVPVAVPAEVDAPAAEPVAEPVSVDAPIAEPAVAAPAEVPFSLDDFVAAESGENSKAAPVEVGGAPKRDLPTGAAAFEEAERLKRVAREYHATSALDSAKNALRQRDYPRAILMYNQALANLPPRPDMEPVIAEARKGRGAAYYLQALSLERMEDYEKAKIAAESAVKDGYVRAEETVSRIKSKIDAPPTVAPPSATHRWREEDYQKTQSQVKEFLKRGREAYLTGEYDRAILAFESVLARDPENKEATRLMNSAANKQYDRSSMELNATAARMVATVRDTWNPRHYGLHETPIEAQTGGTTKVTGDEEAKRAAVLDKMSKIRIPEVDFRQANIRDVVKFLFEQSVEFDPAPNPADRKGVTIILKLDGDSGTTAAAPVETGGGFDFGAPVAAAPGAANETLVTFSALDITLKDALDYSVDIAKLKYLIRGSAVMVMPANEAGGKIEHRMYDVLPSAITRLRELSTAVTSGGSNARRGGGNDFIVMEGSSNAGSGEEVDLKEFFKEMGVEWPNKSQIKFVSGLGKLVVANTLENLTVFEKVLSILNVVPYQIEIEARFIEVAQTDVDSLGLEWLLNDNWEIAQKKGADGTPLGSRERIEMTANSGTGGFTAGNRFLSSAGVGVNASKMTDTVASISGVLTNPELTLVLHALEQSGHTDLLSAPKITTQSGQAATIKVVTEYIYPTEFETSGIGGNNNTTTTGNNNGGGVVGAVVTPSEFATREVGVILEVTPEVSPEGQMISLSLSPEVVSEPTWRNYGSSYTSYDPQGNPVVQQLNMEQPFFHTRKLTTNLLIYNGATVVMGGMITEVRNMVDDQVPLLGDVPLIGRLFRSKYESSEKRNLLIFVTARLVDPSGRALDKERFGVDKSIAERIVAADQPSN